MLSTGQLHELDVSVVKKTQQKHLLQMINVLLKSFIPPPWEILCESCSFQCSGMYCVYCKSVAIAFFAVKDKFMFLRICIDQSYVL